jgi:hypothetical protein
MRNYLLGLWKTFVIVATGLVVAWLANRGIHLSDAQTSWVTIALVSAGLSAYNTVVNFLLARVGDTPLSKLARALGKLLSLGGEAPTYQKPVASRPHL